MFTNARIKLTAWYLAIIMIISLLFSVAVYRASLLELRRGLRIQAFRYAPDQIYIEPQLFSLPGFPPATSEPLTQIFEESRERIISQLLAINIGIFLTAGVAGYFLAGRTLRPIAQILEEQKAFVANASHELRTPLTAIRTETEVAIRDKRLDKDSRNLLKSNLEEIEKMQFLTNNLLSLSRYQDNPKNYPRTTINLAGVVDDALKRLKPIAKNKKIIIEKNLQNIMVYVNYESLVQLFTILLDNAIKYSQPGGRVIVTTRKIGATAVATVQDFGNGISAADLPHIFNRFYRAEKSRTKEETDGYGLGLAIAKTIAKLNHARISVKSKPSAGSTFKVAF